MKKFLTVMNALDFGMEVEIEGGKYVLTEDNQVVLVGERFKTVESYKEGKGETVYLRVDHSLNGFIAMCEEIPEPDIIGISASIALTKMTEQKRMIRNGLQ